MEWCSHEVHDVDTTIKDTLEHNNLSLRACKGSCQCFESKRQLRLFETI